MLLQTTILLLCVSTPNHPKDIVFPDYVFTPPVAAMFEETLDNGVPVFMMENKELPLIQLVATFKGGSYLETDILGATSIMESMVRNGGTTSVSAEDVDEQLAFLAANVGVNGDGTTITATLNSLAANFDDSFALFVDMLQNPGFQDSRLSLEKENSIEGLKQRNDHPNSILGREYASQLFGESYLGRSVVEQNILDIDKGVLIDNHSLIVNPSNLVLSVSGDFDSTEMLNLLNAGFGAWDSGEGVSSPPSVQSEYIPGIYYVDQDVPQGGVRIGIRTVGRDHPDVEAMEVMNYILGGGGFGSRITQNVRSDEGLAYSVGSRFSSGTWGGGVWGAGYESKNSTVALAAMLIFDEIERIKTELVGEEELALAKSALVEQFPSVFQSKNDALAIFVNDKITGRNPEYWSEYRDNVNGVTAEDVRRVANDLLQPADMVVVIVGNWNEIVEGDIGGRATINDVQGVIRGPIVELPLRDPLSLEVIDNGTN